MRLNENLWLGRARKVGIPIALFAAVFIFLRQVNPHYPIQKWLFWRYAECWVLCAVFAAS